MQEKHPLIVNRSVRRPFVVSSFDFETQSDLSRLHTSHNMLPSYHPTIHAWMVGYERCEEAPLMLLHHSNSIATRSEKLKIQRGM